MDEADETVRKLKWALLIQREAYQHIRCNPCGVPQGPSTTYPCRGSAPHGPPRRHGIQETERISPVKNTGEIH